MPPARSREFDVDRLPAAGEARHFVLPQSSLPRLAAGLTAAEGEVRATVTFDRHEGTPLLTVEAATEVALTCQRCLGPLRLPLTSESRVGLVESMEQADRLPAEVEPVWVEDGRVDLGELVEEELLLALPLVPAHERGDAACVAVAEVEEHAGVASSPDDDDAAPVVQTPFAELGELLKRGK